MQLLPLLGRVRIPATPNLIFDVFVLLHFFTDQPKDDHGNADADQNSRDLPYRLHECRRVSGLGCDREHEEEKSGSKDAQKNTSKNDSPIPLSHSVCSPSMKC